MDSDALCQNFFKSGPEPTPESFTCKLAELINQAEAAKRLASSPAPS